MMNKIWMKFIFSLMVMVVLVVGCRKPVSEESSSQAAYDPKADPLVNPACIFEAAPEDGSKIASDETLFLLLEGSPNTLNPLFVSSGYEFTVVDTLFEGVLTVDKDYMMRANENIVESIVESNDHTTFTLTLKPGLTWHDGQPLTAEDIVYSWEQILDDQVPCPAQKPSTKPIKECVAVDERTVRYVQPEVLATSFMNLQFPILPKHLLEVGKEEHPDLKTGTYYNDLARNPMGCGAYRFVEWKDNDKIVVERWEDYPGEKPYFKRIVFRIIPDQNVSLLSFEKQDIDVIDRLSAQKFARETNTDSFREVGYKVWGSKWQFNYIGWNMDGSNPFFADKRVRYAMTHALNIPLILEKLYYNLYSPCYGIYHPDSWMFNPEVTRLEYDPDRSGVLLDEAGWKMDPADGWRYKEVDGQKVKFKFEILYSQGSPTAPQIAAIFQDDLKRIGIEMTTRSLEWAAFLEKVRKHEFQSEMASWGAGVDPDSSWNLWRTEEYGKGRNYVGYSNARVDELFELGRKEFDFEKRQKIYQDIHKLIYEDQPYTWMSNEPLLSAVHKRIRGVQVSPGGIFNFDPSFNAWWVPKGQGRAAAMP